MPLILLLLFASFVLFIFKLFVAIPWLWVFIPAAIAVGIGVLWFLWAVFIILLAVIIGFASSFWR
jgi:hypothetical protein